jgi:hypothetical protein
VGDVLLFVVAGVTLLTLGVGLIYVPAALMLLGVFFLVLAYILVLVRGEEDVRR